MTGWRQKAPVATPSLPSARSAREVARTRAEKAATSWAAGVPATSSGTSGCSAARLMKVTPKSVSARVVKTATAPARPSRGKRISAPGLRPIQFRCMVSTRSGQPVRRSRSRSSSSA